MADAGAEVSDAAGMGTVTDPGAKPKDSASSAFGAKTISWWGSYVLNLNNCMGAAVVTLPLVNHQAGWLTPVLSLFIVFSLSSFAATMVCETAQRIPGNERFQKRIEFCDLVRYYYGQRAYVITQIAYNVSLQASNIAAMIVSAQVLDDFIIHIFGASYAFDYYTFTGIRSETHRGNTTAGDGRIWEDPHTHQPTATVISLGYVLSMVLCIPFGVMKLDENMWFQWLSFAGLIAFTFEFIVQFIMNMVPGDPGYTPGTGPELSPMFVPSRVGQSQVLGIAMFAFAWVVTIPSWLNEKRSDVPINSAVWWPAFTAFSMQTFVGILGSWAFLHPTSNILNNLASPIMPEFSRYSSYLWNLLTLVPGIPILAIISRYSLVSGGITTPFVGNLTAVVLPWIITMFLYERQLLNTLCNWVAILVQGYVNFLVPMLVYRRAMIEFPLEDDGVEWARPSKAAVDDDLSAGIDTKGISMKVKSHTHEPSPGSGAATAFVGDDHDHDHDHDHDAEEGGPGEVGGEEDDDDQGEGDGLLLSPLARAPSLRRKAKGRSKARSPGGDHSESLLSAAADTDSPEPGILSGKRVLGDGDKELTRMVDDDELAYEHAKDEGATEEVARVRAIPAWMRRFVTPMAFTNFAAVFLFVLCTSFVIYNIYAVISGEA